MWGGLLVLWVGTVLRNEGYGRQVGRSGVAYKAAVGGGVEIKRTGKNLTAGKLRTGNRSKSSEVAISHGQEGCPQDHGSLRHLITRSGHHTCDTQ